jgi:AraC family transcriptional regulator
MSPSLDALNLLTREQLAHWRGLPLYWVTTPEGVWNHSFTPAGQGAGLSLVTSGVITTRMSAQGRGADLDLRAGALGLYSSGVEVKVNQAGASDSCRIILSLDTRGMLPERLFDDTLVATALRPAVYFRDEALVPVLREMLGEIRAGCPNGSLFAESLSVGVALHLSRTRGLRPAPAEHGKLSASQWSRLNELIENELASDLSLSTMAVALGLSTPHFVRLFRNTVGTSPHRYVVQKRIERARRLIGSADIPLIDIALRVGFASQSHLTRLFREIIGVTPGEIRKQMAGKRPR